MKIERRPVVPQPPDLEVVLTLSEREARILRVIIGDALPDIIATKSGVTIFVAGGLLDGLYAGLGRDPDVVMAAGQVL